MGIQMKKRSRAYMPKTGALLKKQCKYWIRRLQRFIQERLVSGLSLLVVANMATVGVIPNVAASINPSPELAIAGTSMAHEASMQNSKRTIPVVVTAYSSTADQTDDTPWITASGALVDHDVIAANFLPFNTRIQIPALFGSRVFIVKDRMAKRFSDRVDIWFPDRESAKKFGKHNAEIVVL